MGKTTVLKQIAVSWSDEAMNEMAKFDFVFHIALKHVKDNSPIENIIIAQHSGLEANRVKPEEIKAILEGQTNCNGKALLLLDGHDEYKPGTNYDTDKLIERKTLWNCSLILSSRETGETADVKNYMDAEFEILGFGRSSITKLLRKIHKQKAELLSKTENNDEQKTCNISHSFLNIPMFLNIICSLVRNDLCLPRTETEVFEYLVQRIIDREAIRSRGRKEFDTAKTLVYLGKLAWKGLSTHNFVFSKVNFI